MLSEVLINNIMTTCSALILACLGICYKSKCKRYLIGWGFLQIDRDIEAEVKEDLGGLDMPSTRLNIEKSTQNHNSNTRSLNTMDNPDTLDSQRTDYRGGSPEELSELTNNRYSTATDLP